MIVVASVSCIYGLGAPDDFRDNVLGIMPKQKYDRDELIKRLVGIRYERNDFALSRGKFRVKGDTLEINTASENVTRIEFFGDQVDRITEVDALTGKTIRKKNEAIIYPATEYTVARDSLDYTIKEIEMELASRVRRAYSG